MDETYDQIAKRALALARADDLPAALEISNTLAQQNQDDFRVWSLLGHLHSRDNAYELAVADLTAAIALNDLEPVLFFDRGRYLLSLARWDTRDSLSSHAQKCAPGVVP